VGRGGLDGPPAPWFWVKGEEPGSFFIKGGQGHCDGTASQTQKGKGGPTLAARSS